MCLLCVFFHKKECMYVVALTLIAFAVYQLPVQIPVQLLLELEANLLDQNVNLNYLECR